jgi:disulfide oxidoreductase YuzD
MILVAAIYGDKMECQSVVWAPTSKKDMQCGHLGVWVKEMVRAKQVS